MTAVAETKVATKKAASKKAATKAKAGKKGAKKGSKKVTKKTSAPREVGPSKQLVTVLKSIKSLGGKAVPKAKIVSKSKGMEETHVGHQLYHARQASPPLVVRKVHEDGTMEFTLTAAGAKIANG